MAKTAPVINVRKPRIFSKRALKRDMPLYLMLLVPVSRDTAPQPDAVSVMSTGVYGYREVLQEIDEPASADSEDDSVFDAIGRMFAGLLFGE